MEDDFWEEKFALVDDMKRAARSTTHNLAEGFGRFHFQEYVQFCRISRGSLYELVDQLITSKDDGYITSEEYEKGRSLISKALPLLNGRGIGYGLEKYAPHFTGQALHGAGITPVK